jgi:hypothetical protein
MAGSYETSDSTTWEDVLECLRKWRFLNSMEIVGSFSYHLITDVVSSCSEWASRAIELCEISSNAFGNCVWSKWSVLPHFYSLSISVLIALESWRNCALCCSQTWLYFRLFHFVMYVLIAVKRKGRSPFLLQWVILTF